MNPVRVTQEMDLYDLEDFLIVLLGLVDRNVLDFRKRGVINPLQAGLYRYELTPPDTCDAEFWPTLRQAQQGRAPYRIECEGAASGLCAYLRYTRKDPKATLRLIQINTTAHVQVVSKGAILDPSVALGMKVPQALRKDIYDLKFTGALL